MQVHKEVEDQLRRLRFATYRDLADAMLMLGQVAEARCTQLVNPHFTYVCKIAKRYLGGAAHDL